MDNFIKYQIFSVEKYSKVLFITLRGFLAAFIKSSQTKWSDWKSLSIRETSSSVLECNFAMLENLTLNSCRSQSYLISESTSWQISWKLHSDFVRCISIKCIRIYIHRTLNCMYTKRKYPATLITATFWQTCCWPYGVRGPNFWGLVLQSIYSNWDKLNNINHEHEDRLERTSPPTVQLNLRLLQGWIAARYRRPNTS